MAAPQDGYGAQDYPAEYAQQQAPGFGAPAASPPPPAGAEQHEGGKKKKRGYAAQAYDFGAGANSALGGQAQGGGAFPPPQTPAYGGGYAAPQDAHPGYGAPQYGAPVGAPGPGALSPGFAGQPPYGSVGYQAPDAGYPGPGAPAPGVGGITQGIGQMGMGGAPQMAPPQPGQPQSPQGAGRPAVLNQLYPTDLLNQPFNVAELELPPPPIILPPNVRFSKEIESWFANRFTVQRYAFTRCKLPAQICPIDSERCPYYTFSPQKVEASFCASHPAIHFTPRRR